MCVFTLRTGRDLCNEYSYLMFEGLTVNFYLLVCNLSCEYPLTTYASSMEGHFQVCVNEKVDYVHNVQFLAG